MTKARLRAWLALALVLLASSGCTWLKQLVSGGLERPTLEFVRAELEAASLEGVDLALVYRVENPNEVDLRVVRASYALEVEGKPLASCAPAGELLVPASSTAEVRFPARVRFAELGSLFELLSGKRSLRYRASGTVALDTPLGPYEVPFSRDGEVPLPALPKLSVTKLRLEKLSGLSVSLLVGLRVANENDFPLPVEGLRGALVLDGARLAEGEARGAPIPPRSTGELELPLTLDLTKAGKAARRLLSGGATALRVEGTLDLGELELPAAAGSELPVEGP